MINRKMIAFFLLPLLVVGLGIWFVNYLGSYNYASVVYGNGISDKPIVKIYRVEGDNPELSNDYFIKDEFLKKTVNSDSKFRLKKGSYIYVSGDNGGYEKTKGVFRIDTEPQTITVNPSYSSNKLDDLLKQEQENIQSIIKNEFPDVGSTYRFGEENLYVHGEWYGAILIPQTQDLNSDILRIVLQKENDTWKIITNPPQIIISSKVFPNIPRDILIDLNSR